MESQSPRLCHFFRLLKGLLHTGHCLVSFTFDFDSVRVISMQSSNQAIKQSSNQLPESISTFQFLLYPFVLLEQSDIVIEKTGSYYDVIGAVTQFKNILSCAHSSFDVRLELKTLASAGVIPRPRSCQ